MTDTYLVQLADVDVADAIWSAGLAAAPNGRLSDGRAVVAVGVAAGRKIGARQALEPLDDAMRTAAEGALEQIENRGLTGLTMSLRRLDAFLKGNYIDDFRN